MIFGATSRLRAIGGELVHAAHTVVTASPNYTDFMRDPRCDDTLVIRLTSGALDQVERLAYDFLVSSTRCPALGMPPRSAIRGGMASFPCIESAPSELSARRKVGGGEEAAVRVSTFF